MSSSSRTPTAVAQRRIQSELRDWLQHPPDGCHLVQYDDLHTWVIELTGPESPCDPQLYVGSHFRLRIVFSERYPLEPPEVTFVPPSPVHPHIYSNGHICLDILYDGHNGGWSPALTINKVALSLRSMLASNTELRRPPGDADYCARMRGRSPKETRPAAAAATALGAARSPLTPPTPAKMGVHGAGNVFNEHWRKNWNGKEFNKLLRSLAPGAVVGVAHTYMRNVPGAEDLIVEWDTILKEKGGRVKVLLDGFSPDQKKAGEDRKHVGTDVDPVRGTAARECQARLQARGVDCHLCESEQDFWGILLASLRDICMWVEQDTDAVLPLMEIFVRQDWHVRLVRVRSDGDSQRVMQMLDMHALVASLKLADPMDKVQPSQEELKHRAYLLGLVVRAVASGDYGRPLTGLSFTSLWELAQHAVREKARAWLQMLDEGQGPAVLQEILLFFKGPNPDYPKVGTISMRYVNLMLVTSSGPYRDASGKACTALPMPLLSAEEAQ